MANENESDHLEDICKRYNNIKMDTTKMFGWKVYWIDQECTFVNALTNLGIIQVFNFKVDRILIWVIYLLRFTTCYITQLTCIYSKCWKWCKFISVHLSTHFTMFLANFLSVLSFTSSMARVIFIFNCFRSRGLVR